MSFLFSQVNGSHRGMAEQPIGTGTFYGAALQQGIHDTLLASTYRMSEYNVAGEFDPETNPMIPFADANHRAQQEGLDLKFESDLTLGEFDLSMQRKREERDRGLILSTGTTGVGRTVGSFGTAFLGSLLSPPDLALMFVPVVGQEVKAGMAVRSGSKLARAVQRGLINRKTIEGAGMTLKGYTEHMLEASVGSALAEIPLFLSNTQDKTGYTAEQFGLAVGLGAVFGAAVNTGRLMLSKAYRAHFRLSEETRGNMGVAAIEDFLRGDPIDPGRLSLLDDNARSIHLRLAESTAIRAPGDNSLELPQDMSPGGSKKRKAYKIPAEIIDHVKAWSEFGGRTHPGLRAFVYENPRPSKKPVYRNFEGVDQLKVGDELTPEQRGFGGWSSGTDLHDSWSNDAGGRLVLDGKYVLLPHEEILKAAKKHGVDGDYLITDAESFIDDRLTYKVTKVVDTPNGKDIYIAPTGEPTVHATDALDDPDGPQRPGESDEDYLDRLLNGPETPSSEAAVEAAVRQQLEQLKNHEQNKAARKQQQLRQEVEAGNTLENPAQHRFGADPTDEEGARIEQEIRELLDELGAEVDPRLTGDVQNIGPALGQRELPHYFDTEFDAEGGGSGPTRGPIFFSGSHRVADARWGWRDSKLVITANEQPVPIYIDPWDGLLSSEAVDGISQGDKQLIKDIEAFILKHTGKKTIYSDGSIDFALEGAPGRTDTYEVGELIQDVWENNPAVLDELSDIFKQYRDRSPGSFDEMMDTLSFVILDRRDLVNAREGRIPSDAERRRLMGELPLLRDSQTTRPYSQWQAFLPEAERKGAGMDGVITHTAEDMAYAAGELDPESKAIYDALFEIDPDLRNVPVDIRWDLATKEGGMGKYYGVKDRVAIDIFHMQPYALLHELTHASAVRRLRNDMMKVGEHRALNVEGKSYLAGLRRYAALTENTGFRQIVEAYLTAVEGHSNPRLIGHINTRFPDVFIKVMGDTFYGFHNLDEFIAEGISNHKFQQYLAAIPLAPKETENLFTRFIEAVKSLFRSETTGEKIGKENALTQLLDGYQKAIKEGGDRADPTYMKKMGFLHNDTPIHYHESFGKSKEATRIANDTGTDISATLTEIPDIHVDAAGNKSINFMGADLPLDEGDWGKFFSEAPPLDPNSWWGKISKEFDIPDNKAVTRTDSGTVGKGSITINNRLIKEYARWVEDTSLPNRRGNLYNKSKALKRMLKTGKELLTPQQLEILTEIKQRVDAAYREISPNGPELPLPLPTATVDDITSNVLTKVTSCLLT